MSDFEQLDYATDFDQIEFAENPEPRCPVLLLLDNSGSMAGDKIAQLNAGLQAFKADLLEDSLAAKRCEIAVVTFGPVQQVSDFVGVADFEPPTLQPMADTPLGAAVLHGLELLRARKEAIRYAAAKARAQAVQVQEGRNTALEHLFAEYREQALSAYAALGENLEAKIAWLKRELLDMTEELESIESLLGLTHL